MPVTSATSTSPLAGPPTTRTPSTNLGKEDFLKLLAGQLKHQNPMSAGGGEEFMAQMTQFAMLEQIQNMAATQERTATSSLSTQAVGMIGKDVTFAGDGGMPVTARVERVLYEDGKPSLVVAGRPDPVALTAVREVA